MIVETFPVGPLGCNCSILGDETSRTAIVVDPGDDIEHVESLLRQHQLTVSAIVITHAHIDHIGGAAKLKAVTGAPVYLNSRDQVLYDSLDVQASWLGIETPERTSIDSELKDGTRLKLGERDIDVRHTPGHTQGSVCLLIPGESLLLAGDTLFKDSIGRTDLPGGNTRQIFASIKDKLLTLPEETVVVCGHGPQTTIGRERRRNPFLKDL